MKTRKSLSVIESKDKNKILNNTKAKVNKLLKSKESLNDTSYRESHNIGRRKSNNSVITYSLNSHLFFDVYAKFDQNNVPRPNGSGKLSRKSSLNSLNKIHDDSDILRCSGSGDASTDAMSGNECHSNKSSPNRFKVICENNLSPFKSPNMSCVSSPIEITPIKCHTETFQNKLDNKTLFKKQHSVKSKVTKLKSQTNVRRRVSERLSKTILNQSKLDVNEGGTEKAKLKCPRKRKSRTVNDTKMNAVAIITNDKIAEGIEEVDQIEDDKDYNIELAMDYSNNDGIEERIVVVTEDKVDVSTISKEETVHQKENVSKPCNKKKKENNMNAETKKENLRNNSEKVIAVTEDKTDISQICVEEIVDQKGDVNKFCNKAEKENHLTEERKKETKINVEKLSKKLLIHKKMMCSFFDITATGSQRECERSTVKGTSDTPSRVREPGDHKEQGKVSKNGSVLKKSIPVVKIEEEICPISTEEEDNAETLWLWHGEGCEKSIKLQLKGAAVTRTCYPAIKHAKDDVVIQVMDCVMLKSADQEPYLAKITAFFDDEESGKKMMAVLWYYRPEHTNEGRLLWHSEADVYASKHLDTNSVDCIDDKAFVLPIELYARFQSFQKRQSSSSRQGLSARMVPIMADDVIQDLSEPRTCSVPELAMDMLVSSFYYAPSAQSSFPPEMTSANVFVCRGLYDIKKRQVTRDVLLLLQTPVLEPRGPCLSPDSAMSISSCDSDHATSALHSPPLPPSPPHCTDFVVDSAHKHSLRTALPPITSFSSKSTSLCVLPSFLLSPPPPPPPPPPPLPSFVSALVTNGRHFPLHHNGHFH